MNRRTAKAEEMEVISNMPDYTTKDAKKQDVRIMSLELSNVKRIKAVALEPAPTGLTVIGGKNGQGKTSVLDAIAWALGGERFRPDAAQREGSVLNPDIRITLSNGLTVTRKGNKSTLTVTDESGRRSGQQLLNEFIEVLALDLPKFLQASDKERASILLGILGIQDQLDALDREERAAYDQRLQVGRDRDRARHYADELPWHDGAPEQEVSVAALSADLRAVQERNQRNAELRQKVTQIRARLADTDTQINTLQAMRTALETEMRKAEADAEGLQDGDPDIVLRQIQNAEIVNAQVRDNRAHMDADARAAALVEQYDALTAEVEDVRARRTALLDGADMPLPQLSVQDGVLTYNGQPWSCMSSAEQLRAATAIVARLKPECRFVLVDKLEQMDVDTLRDFGAWAAAQGLQVIGTRVSTGGECTVVIEDGEVAAEAAPAQKWKEGTF